MEAYTDPDSCGDRRLYLAPSFGDTPTTPSIMSAAPPHPEQQPIEEPPTAPETAPVPEEPATETLYIQNLNERIQIPGAITT